MENWLIILRTYLRKNTWWQPVLSIFKVGWPAILLIILATLELSGLSKSDFGTWANSGTRHLVWAVIGIILAIIVSQIQYRYWIRFAYSIFFLGVILCLATAFIGSEINGSRSWIYLGPLTFQPVEFLKIGMIIMIARLYANTTSMKYSWWVIILATILFGLAALSVLLQPDLGSVLVLAAIWGIMTLVRGMSPKQWLVGLASVFLVISVAWLFLLKEYQRERIQTYFSPNTDIRGSSYNVRQALVAIGSGGWFGQGIGEGTQSQRQFLPVRQSDFIAAVIGEETGFVGLLFVILMQMLLIVNIWRLAIKVRDDAPAHLAIGIGSLFFIHMFINIGMNMGLIPVTGLPLPFVSSGGSSMLVFWILLGIVGNIAYQQEYRSLGSVQKAKDVEYINT